MILAQKSLWDWLLKLPLYQQILGALISLVAMTWSLWQLLMRAVDRPVLDLLEDQQKQLRLRGGHNLVLAPIPIVDIARECSRPTWLTRKSLLRLEKRGKAHEVKGDCWLPGPPVNQYPIPQLERWRPRW